MTSEGEGQRVADEPRRIAGEAAGRAKGELARVRDVRFNAVQSALIGLLIGCGATAITGGLNAAVDGETGYIVLMAAAVLAAWFGGLVGGIAATLTVTGLNQLLFLDPDLGTRPNPRVDDVRQVLFLVVATGTGSGTSPPAS